MKKKYTLKRTYDGDFYLPGIRICGCGLRGAFDVPKNIEEIDVVLQTTKPRHNDYQVIDLERFFYPILRYDDGDYTVFTSLVDRRLESIAEKAGVTILYVSVLA